MYTECMDVYFNIIEVQLCMKASQRFENESILEILISLDDFLSVGWVWQFYN